MENLFTELKRRNVFRVGGAYLVTCWLVLQIADVVLNNIEAPPWVFNAFLLLMACGLPIVLIVAWAFEVTPEGIKREHEVDRTRSITHQTGRKLDFTIIAMLVVALAYFVVDKFALTGEQQLAQADSGPQGAQHRPGEDGSDGPVDQSIAVLPFVDMSPEGNQEYFADGLSEELLNLLAKIPELRVAARTSAFSYKGKDTQISQIGRELNVAHVLEGSVRTAGNQMRVTAQLIKAKDGYHLWSESYDRTLNDIFAIQDEIAGAVVESLRVTLLGDTLHVAETDPKAYALYLEARFFNNKLDPKYFGTVEDLLNQVLEIDPEYAPAWASLSRLYRNMAISDPGPDSVRLIAKAREAVENALAFDATSDEAHARLALLISEQDQDYEGAAHHYNRAMQLNPGSVTALAGISSTLGLLGRNEDAVRAARAAVARDPINPSPYQSLADAQFLMGDLDEARMGYEKALSISPGMYAVSYRLGLIHLELGQYDEALATFEREIDDEYRMKGRALVFYKTGRQSDFESEFALLKKNYGEQWPSEIAHVYAVMGEKDTAFEWLQRAITLEEDGLLSNRSDPLLVSLHDDPRWPEFLDAIGPVKAC